MTIAWTETNVVWAGGIVNSDNLGYFNLLFWEKSALFHIVLLYFVVHRSVTHLVLNQDLLWLLS